MTYNNHDFDGFYQVVADFGSLGCCSTQLKLSRMANQVWLRVIEWS